MKKLNKYQHKLISISETLQSDKNEVYTAKQTQYFVLDLLKWMGVKDIISQKLI